MRHWNVEEGWGDTDASDVFSMIRSAQIFASKTDKTRLQETTKIQLEALFCLSHLPPPTNQKKSTVTSISTIIPGNITPPPGTMIFHQPHQAPIFWLAPWVVSFLHPSASAPGWQGSPRIASLSLCVPGSLANCFEICNTWGEIVFLNALFFVKLRIYHHTTLPKKTY